MHFQKKLNLSRFKKSMQGLIEFAILIEQADSANREKIMAQAEAQDPDLLFKAMKKVVFFDELIYMEDAIIAEILSKTSPKVLAYAIREMPEEFRQKMLRQIGFREKKAFQEEEERMSKTTSQGLIVGAQKQILKQARVMEGQNKFNFELTSCPRFSQKRKKPAKAVGGAPETLPGTSESDKGPHLRLVKK